MVEGITAGVSVTAMVRSIDIDTGGDTETIDNVLTESHDFPLSAGAQDVDFAFSPQSLIRESEESQSSSQLAVDRVVDLLNRRSYFFTRFLLSGIDPAEFEDLVESLVVGLPDLPGVRLTALIDPRPMGFVGGSVVFRLKRDPDLQKVVNMKTGVLPDLHSGRFDWVIPGFLAGNLTLKNFNLRLGAVRNSVLPFIDYIEEVARREAEEREAAAVRREIALPSPGVFAEAILGRSNAAEKIDPTRYIAWDLPNPNVAPEIAALVEGGRGLDVPDLSPSDTSGELGLQAPTPLPDPTGFAQAFGALAASNLFRDMSGRAELAATLSRLAEVAAQTAGQAASLTGTAQTAALDAASLLAGNVADTVSKVNDTAKSLTELGAKLNAGLPTGQSPTPTPTPTPTPAAAPTPTPSPTVTPGGGGGGTPTPTPAPAITNRVVQLKAVVDVQNGARRELDGRFTVTFVPPGNQFQTPITGVGIETVAGGGGETLVLAPGSYTVRGDYQALRKEDLALLREPQTDSFGVNGDRLMELAVDLFQRDLAGQLTVSVPILSDSVFVTPQTAGVKVDIVALVAEASSTSVEITFNSGNEFTIDSGGRVTFDSSKLGDTAKKIADTMKGGFLSVLGNGVGFVANALSMFTITSTIGTGDALKAGASGKVTFSFRPSFLKDFALTAQPFA